WILFLRLQEFGKLSTNALKRGSSRTRSKSESDAILARVASGFPSAHLRNQATVFAALFFNPKRHAMLNISLRLSGLIRSACSYFSPASLNNTSASAPLLVLACARSALPQLESASCLSGLIRSACSYFSP